MWSTSAGGHLMKVVNLTGFTVVVNFNFYIDSRRSRLAARVACIGQNNMHEKFVDLKTEGKKHLANLVLKGSITVKWT